MKLQFDPGENDLFWEKARRLPGFPHDDDIPLKVMLFESNALYKIPQVLESVQKEPGRELLVVVDPTPMRRGTESLKPLVMKVVNDAGWEAKLLTLEPDASGQVHTDMPRIQQVQSQLKPGMSVLSVGSGVVTDITKHAIYLYENETGNKLTYTVFQSANSVSAFTSNMAPVFIDGVKRTLPSRYSEALICDLETLCDAPYDMTAAGVGDLLAVFISLPDWKLACHLGMDDSCTNLPQMMIGPLDEILMENAESIRQRTPEGMALLAKLISVGGIAMSLSHATTPLSGYEHVMSHILDLLNELRGSPLPQHGTQVSLACVLVAEAYREFLDHFDPAKVNIDSCFPPAEKMQKHILDSFAKVDPSGKAGRECWADYSQKLEKWHTRREAVKAFLQHWEEIKAEIAALVRTPERMKEILAAVNAPLTFAQMKPPAGEEDVHFSFFNAPLMRKRITLGDLLIFFQWDRQGMWPRIWADSQR